MTPREAGHTVAKRVYGAAAQRGIRLVTTAFVIAEVHTLILRWRDVRVGERFLSVAFDSASHTIVDVNQELIAAAIARWIHRYDDQDFSLCDAVSFEVMRRERLEHALTFNRHFTVAGYEILTERSPA
jgi:predicted nucleic acid-binding protein